MSLILRPSFSLGQAKLITLAASLAVTRALDKVANVCPGIKWPNDIILDGKKVCGILTEMNTEINRVNYIVLGIGINFGQKLSDFEEEIQNKAISLMMYLQKNSRNFENIMRSDIIKAVIEELETLYTGLLDGDGASIVEEWKKYSITIGRRISISSGDSIYSGKAIDIAPDGSLVVECEDGTIKTVASGEVSIRGIMGYA
jgi:BirA family biotin operon repressor/biotin-[acetyl-CoA-carboxylase] ligase